MGIKALKPKRAITGAIIYEIPGEGESPREDSKMKADKLTRKLNEVLEGKGIRVNRPTKFAELRMSGLDDSTAGRDVMRVVAQKGKCTEEDVKVSNINRRASGLGSVWIRCPAEAAKILTEEGRVTVGWVSARIEALTPRPLQCFRCLDVGHTQYTCKAQIDRSGTCYRCGAIGHKAKDCKEAPRCAKCADLGRPINHKIGSPACIANSKANTKARVGPKTKGMEIHQDTKARETKKPVEASKVSSSQGKEGPSRASQGESRQMNNGQEEAMIMG